LIRNVAGSYAESMARNNVHSSRDKAFETYEPEQCSHCGCADVEEDFSFGGQTCVICNHCGQRTIIGTDEPEQATVEKLVQVKFESTKCPFCGSRSKIKDTNKRENGVYRVHKCKNSQCGKRFSSTDPD